MKKRINNYIKEIDKKLEKTNNKDLDEIKEKHLNMISFIQHERLINLLITLFVSLFTCISFLLSSANTIFFITTTILVVILLFCSFNYFFYDSALKKLYKEYDKMI